MKPTIHLVADPRANLLDNKRGPLTCTACNRGASIMLKLYPTTIQAHLAVRPMTTILQERFWSGRMTGKEVVSYLRAPARGLVTYSRIECGPRPLPQAFCKAIVYNLIETTAPSALR